MLPILFDSFERVNLRNEYQRRVGLLRPYSSVSYQGKDSYGGNQEWFADSEKTDVASEYQTSNTDKSETGSVDMKMKQFGCGIIALADVLRYMYPSKWDTQMAWPAYQELIRNTRRAIGGINARFGVSWLQYVIHIPRLSVRHHLKLRAFWGLSRKKLPQRVREMLANDTPVILCIPYISGKAKWEYAESSETAPCEAGKKVKRGLWLYTLNKDGELVRKIKTSAHYVVVTGIYEARHLENRAIDGNDSENDETVNRMGLQDGTMHVANTTGVENNILYEVSSWGKKYYIREVEHLELMDSVPFGAMLGNVLVLKR